MSTSNLVGRSERSNSFQREKKEVYISESAFSQLQIHRKKHISPLKNSYGSARKADESIFMTSNSSNDVDQPNQILLNKPEKSNQMKRLKIMKTSILDNDLPALGSERSSMIMQEIEKRFDKSTIFMPAAKDPKWAEFKIIGSNIQSRSRSSICVQAGYLYVYGGYEVKAGQLGDFWRVNLNSDQFVWEQVKSKSKTYPDRLSRQSSCVYKDKFYLFGGQNGCLQSNNNLWCFDFKTETWTLIKPNNNNNSDHMPSPIDSHSSVLISDRFYVLFGYFADSGTLSNAVYEYSFTSNEWICLFVNNHHLSHNNLPKARFESAVTYLPSKVDSIYAFGGTDGFVRMNDLWEFNLKTKQYLQIIPVESPLPLIRSGHQLFTMNNQIVVLGGIHDITWEVDDLCIFNLSNSKWSIVDADSARRKDSLPKLNVSQGIQDKSQNQTITLPEIRATRSQSFKKTLVNGVTSPTKRQSSVLLSPMRKTKASSMTVFERELYNDEESNPSQGLINNPTVLVEQKRKEFLQRKAQMLQTFEISIQQEQSYRDMSPTSEAMKNSLFMMGNPMPSLKIRSGRLTDFGRTAVSRFIQPLKDQLKIRLGKKPCARDGHRIAYYGKDKLLVFGGDRHNMSFNDIYQLDLELLQQKYNDFVNK